MTLPEDLVLSDDLNVITSHSEFTDASGTILYVSDNYYHVPFFFFYIVFTMLFFIFYRLTIEFIKRLAKRSNMFSRSD